MVKMRVMEIPISRFHRPGLVRKKKGLVIHSTSNDARAINERNNLARPDNNFYVSFHYAVDEDEAIQIIPDNEVAYHGGNKEANHEYISIEICERVQLGEAVNNTAMLCASLLKQYGWGVNDMKRHFDFLQGKKGKTYYKPCPRILQKDNWRMWGEFKMLVQKYLDKLNEESKSMERDVNKVSDYAVEHLKNMKEMGVTSGERPNDYVTRQEVVTMLDRYDKIKK